MSEPAPSVVKGWARLSGRVGAGVGDRLLSLPCPMVSFCAPPPSCQPVAYFMTDRETEADREGSDQSFAIYVGTGVHLGTFMFYTVGSGDLGGRPHQESGALQVQGGRGPSR